MSCSHFFRIFHKATGTSPIDWLRRELITRAKERLIETNDSMAEVAEIVGYSEQSYFSRDFKQMTQMTPSQFRARERIDRSQVRSPVKATAPRKAMFL